jgi:hypothetical protein
MGNGPGTELAGVLESTPDRSIVAYPCPHCHAPLVARSEQTYGWLRCPRCGRPGLPPEPEPEPERASQFESGELPGGDEPAGGRSRLRGGLVRRVSAASALFLSLLNALFAVLANDRPGASFFGVIALGCLALAVYPGRRRRRDVRLRPPAEPCDA